MFVKSFVASLGGAVHAPRPMSLVARALPSHVRADCAVRVAACAARAHFIVALPPDRATVAHASGLPQAGGARRFAANQLRRAGKMAARAAIGVAYVGSPLTPAGYAILAMTVAAVALVAMLSTSSVGNELGRALRLSWWFY
ncbi:hypothetical protein [Paraburkholderia sp. RL17-337-BIB-A]|uniref:hypothetical protein n=1 Tax=Paraburkholderia sp. RL17-337-BIB-A TaxID=3031636 RepID=UPI0038B7729E